MVAGAQFVVELGPRFSGPVPRPGSGAVGGKCNHNPISLLAEFRWRGIERRAAELVLHSRINYAYRRQREYLEADRTWGARHAGVLRPRPVAYFSAEFGLHESMPIYSGGLGILAGDHIKSASDLDIPLIGIGLFYGQGYFRQRLDRNGWQQEEYIQTDVNQLPMEPAIGTNGEPVTVQIETRTGLLFEPKVWRVKVGRCDLLLLDSNVEGNAPEDRELTSRLYGGDAPDPHSAGVAAWRWRISRAESDGDYARRAAFERRAQRIRGARSDSQPHAGGGLEF